MKSNKKEKIKKMNALQIILGVVIALLGYPLGLIIAYFTQEELKSGRKWFRLIMLGDIILIILSIILFSAELNTLMFLLSSFIFIFLLALASFIKSKKKRKIIRKRVIKR
jgi:ABC-type antimicrobial peptide transport system permease subunit